jgi:hypothetical protein
MSARFVSPIRDLFGQHPRAARFSSEQVAGLLWILRYDPDEEDLPPEPFEVAGAPEVLDVERGIAA